MEKGPEKPENRNISYRPVPDEYRARIGFGDGRPPPPRVLVFRRPFAANFSSVLRPDTSAGRPRKGLLR